MYLPPQFTAKDPAIALELMRAHPFASLISNDDEGLPFVTLKLASTLDEAYYMRMIYSYMND